MVHFVIGTRAQLFKMAPLMLECGERNIQWRWIYAAQHKETMEQTLRAFGLPDPHYTVFEWSTEANTMSKYFYWFSRLILSLIRGKKILGGYTGKQNILLTHGDTSTTFWGALLGKLYRCKVMHVESGLRSFKIFEPFPEEINRLLTFRLTDIYACPGEWAVENLKKYKGVKLNTGMNTQIDTLHIALKKIEHATIELPKEKFAIASLHRYENIFKEKRLLRVINLLEEISQKMPLLFIQHPATKAQLEKLGYTKRIERNPYITLLSRLEHLDFIAAIKKAEFVITDGGGNQEELFHIGKPTLIFREATERKEGLGTTAVLSKLDSSIIDDFVEDYKKYQHEPVGDYESPTDIIIDYLEENIVVRNTETKSSRDVL